jgi:hypothetical protein
MDWSAMPGTSAANRCSAATLLLRGKARTPAHACCSLERKGTPHARVLTHVLCSAPRRTRQDAALADVSCLSDRALYAPWAPEPLKVACCATRFGRCDMTATLLANASCAALPAKRMLRRAYAMYASRAYCHQYAAHGLELGDFDAAFARVEDAAAAYGL